MQACPYDLLRVASHILHVIFIDFHRFSRNTHSSPSNFFIRDILVFGQPSNDCSHPPSSVRPCQSLAGLITRCSKTLAGAPSLSLVAFHSTALPAKIKIRHQLICLQRTTCSRGRITASLLSFWFLSNRCLCRLLSLWLTFPCSYLVLCPRLP